MENSDFGDAHVCTDPHVGTGVQRSLCTQDRCSSSTRVQALDSQGDFCLVSAPALRVPFRPFETPNSLAFRCTLTVVSLSLQKGKPPLDYGTWFQGVGSLPDREHVSCWCLETHIQALATPTRLPAVCWTLAKQCFFRFFLGVRVCRCHWHALLGGPQITAVSGHGKNTLFWFVF